MSSLGWYWLVVPVALALLGIVFVLAGLGHLFAGRVAHGSRHLLFGFPVVAVGLAFGLIALSAQNFARLTHESDVAMVDVKALDPTTGAYAVTVKRIDGSPLDHSYAQHRTFGSASYMPLTDGAIYKVMMTQSSLNAEPVNDAARKANAAR